MWLNSFANELGRLSQGYKLNEIKGTHTLCFMTCTKTPKYKKPTHARTWCEYRPYKTAQHITRITVGRDRLQHSGETAPPTASITTTKMYLNSTISTESAWYCTADMKDFYLNSKLDDCEYLSIGSHIMPSQFTQDYNLSSIAKKK